MDVQGLTGIRVDYLEPVNETVRNGIARAEAVERYQAAAYTFHVRKNILHGAFKLGRLVDVAA
ncbi:MAG: hypothetical protein PHG65_00100 [Kiritimatiellae bacterium]|nr:hypothetical protein [Kiritimatiellia bacterium]